ncbi:glycosyltransferase family 87 protein [Thermomonas carbonis]|uniref:DUF2029 domain-containing protein n=1 Tax=Thermomonas carbonis TaxID=1463158 RepID=A0A7G9SMP3_9GAMM|nr:glycosyltransferase family 87 protein [Thermomonas carbonis]QNN69118.1 DUF2029 domain-containing protein [Thermomonas carbonis]GHC06618.1 hypothetical protein GCM10010080_20980 [Thermomonas carbonis]
MTASPLPRIILWLAIVLALCASAYLVRGVHVAVSERGSYDLASRGVEYRLYASGIYPNQSIASDALPTEDLPNSVYPPYAFPMLAAVFAWESPVAAGWVFGILTLTALLAVAAHGYRDLRYLGWQSASLGAVSGLAIAQNSSAVAFGQFSIISMGFVAGQVFCLRRGQRMAAGACWAMAMFKPQIGLVFALLFVADRNWRGLAFGLAILGALSWLACWQTQASPFAVLDYWFQHADLRFITAGNSGGSSAGGILANLGSDPRVAVAISLVAALTFSAGTWLRGRNRGFSMLTLLALCAIVGRVFIPHRAYDNIMLYPALIALLALALERKDMASRLVAAVFGVTLWIPLTSLIRSAWLDAALLCFWLATAAFLILQSTPTHGSHHRS